MADFAVVRRSCIRGEKEEGLPGYFGKYAGAGTAEDAVVCGGLGVSAEAKGTDGRLLEVEPVLGLRECDLDVIVLGAFRTDGVSLYGMPNSAVAEAGAEPDVPLVDAFSSSSVGILES